MCNLAAAYGEPQTLMASESISPSVPPEGPPASAPMAFMGVGAAAMLALLVVLLPGAEALPAEGQRMAAIFVVVLVLWTTEASLHRQEAVLTELVEITLPANSRAIGAAAERGDLSENSEWQYAVEEQRRLNARVAQLRDDLTRARIIRADDIPDDQVSVGSHVVLRGSDGREVELTILGPWESDVEKRIYNYKTPLAQSLLGADVGVQVTLKLTGTEDEYVIERISRGVTSLGERSE